jgi:cardiolipin synthase
MQPTGWTMLGSLIAALAPLLAITTAGHALLYQRDPRTAIGWIGVCLFFPIAGPILYYLFGINRISTRAKELHRRLTFRLPRPERSDSSRAVSPQQCSIPPDCCEIITISNAVTHRPMLGGNHLDILYNGEQAYPAMLESIAGAKRTCFLSSYIFATDRTGRSFIDALRAAADRGADVRVIIDGIGEYYSLPRISRLLKKENIRFVRFLPPKLMPPSLFVNLRNHRKILVVDGTIGYTGGMNIRDNHLVTEVAMKKRVSDLHFRLQGPIVRQITQVFLEDWGFCTGEHPSVDNQMETDAAGALCRTIVDGPNEDLDKLATILTGAIHTARRRIRIMTPYFLPTREMISALQITALRGVDIAIILPAKNNLPFVHWACRNMLWELLQIGIKIYYQPPPFAHTKLFITDEQYVHVGTANLDPRSLRLNFELAVEVCNKSFVEKLIGYFENVRQLSSPVSLKEIDSRPLPWKIRDALAWIFYPYL